jgi:predicted site-specific integrase-resolvase
MSRGPLMTIKEAAEKGGITTASIYNYEKNGYLQFVEMPGGFRVVYYRDVLRAAWAARQGSISGGQKGKRKSDSYYGR